MRMFLMLCAVALVGCGPAKKAPDGGPCCKTCVAGKACGDSCIDNGKACSAAAGCACNDD